ncbi:biotin synthase BioB [Allofranklinella schreckenbergeri]|uniref:Biotin synthase n=1 Tax=Allofranklinella schreckenbergeri TaxID=1076744 RepID=A0A3M6QW20_9BURK|nr:biotin synthase BioB [Allofranklinella schreckenbergeri]RMX07173.1 biotin synthase BioB [Allofranklinella schreckenbergeri]
MYTEDATAADASASLGSSQPLVFHKPAQPRPAPTKPQRWSVEAIQQLLDLPFMDLLYQAQTVHRQHWPKGDVELATLLSVKTGGCPENCGYCPQSAEYDTGVKAQKLLSVDEVTAAAQAAKDAGATRFCMGAAWRAPKDRDIEKVVELIAAVKGLGMETCATMGMLQPHQAKALRAAGLDYYNHNLDTAPEYYQTVVDTRNYQDRLDTLQAVRDAGINVCCGGIIGMGEAPVHRAGLIAQLANLDPYPESVPINSLVPVPGTPLADSDPVDPLDFVRIIAVARITMPKARVRLSAGRQQLGEAVQALCFLAGANSIFYGDKLLVTGNPEASDDARLLAKLGINGRHTQVQPEHGHAHEHSAGSGCGSGQGNNQGSGGCGCGG